MHRRSLGLAALGVFLALGQAVCAAEPPGPVSRPIGAYDATVSGQALTLPQGAVRVTVFELSLAPGGVLPPHKHPWPRYAYVLAGRLRVTNLETGIANEFQAGDFVVDPRDQWHEALALGTQTVRLLVIDQAPPGESNLIRR